MIKLSRFAVEESIRCPRCFVLAYKHKIRLPMIPFTLNIALDQLVKNEFDHYRAEAKPHPLFLEHDIDAVPFAHAKMDDWRHNFRGAYFTDEDKGFTFGGAIDDIWEKPDGQIIIADTKATAKENFDWLQIAQTPWGKSYQRQLEMYQWTFRNLGYDVAPEGYLTYYNARKKEPMFNQEMKFDFHLIRLEGDPSWVQDAILRAKAYLEQKDLPEASCDCEKCNYLKDRWVLAREKPIAA